MTKEFNKEEYNKMCANLLGEEKKGDDVTWTFPEYLNGKVWVDEHFFNGTDEYCGRRQTEVSELKFDSDWDWIMEVVEKIEEIYYLQPVHILGNTCNILTNRTFKFSKDSKKEAVVHAIWHFLNWYKENKE